MGIPDEDILAKLKLIRNHRPLFFFLVLHYCQIRLINLATTLKLNMISLEALRLYCPIIGMIRDASEDIKLGNLMIPKDTCLAIPIIMIHRSKEYRGEDADEFNPLRFKNGAHMAKNHPHAFLVFAMGPRGCIGQNFAMIKPKLVLVLLFQKLSLTRSSEYKHAPVTNLTLQPRIWPPYHCQISTLAQ